MMARIFAGVLRREGRAGGRGHGMVGWKGDTNRGGAGRTGREGIQKADVSASRRGKGIGRWGGSFEGREGWERGRVGDMRRW